MRSASRAGTLPVEVGALRILLSPFEPVERPDAREETRDLGRGSGQGQSDDLGTTCTDLRAFEWVVVDKNEGVHADLELSRQRAEVLGLGLPVDPPGREVLAPQQHVGVSFEHGKYVFFGVLAAKAEQHAVTALGERELLQSYARWVDDHTERPVLADDSAPQCLVAVQDEYLRRRRLGGAKRAHDLGSESREESRRIRDVAVGLRAGVVVRLDLVTGEQVVRGSYVHPAERGKAIEESRPRRDQLHEAPDRRFEQHSRLGRQRSVEVPANGPRPMWQRQ